MDNDGPDENNSRAAHGDELNKLRATAASPSPSALSTASSGSPLVRGSSGGAGKRPAPTSIAAAQLQCQQQQLQQQQQQLEFTNRMMGAKRSHGSKHRHNNGTSSAGSLSPTFQAARQLDWSPMGPDDKLRVDAPTPFSNSSDANGKKAKKMSKMSTNMGSAAAAATTTNDNDGGDNSNSAHNKSLGYNVAKSIAFRAYRFNEFLSVNKMRYMNLACLLMTLICLVTILIFTGTNSNSPPPATAASTLNQAKPFVGSPGATGSGNNRRLQPTTTDYSESLDSLNSQPLVSGGSGSATQISATAANGANQDNMDESSNLFDARTRDNNSNSNSNKSSARRESQLLAQQAGEREIEEPAMATTTTTGTLGQPQAITEPGSMANGDWNGGNRWLASSLSSGRRQPGDTFISPQGSLIDPILNQIFQDMELGNLFKPLRRHLSSSSSSLAGNNSNPTSSPSNTMMMMFKPVIRRSKNGATIVISGGASSLSSASSNDSLNLNDLQLPSLIEKLLPPMLRPSMSGGSGSAPVMMMTMTMKPFSHHNHNHNHHHHGSPLMMMGPLASILDAATNSANATNGTSGSGNGNGLASATITFGGGQPEPVMASASSSLPMARLSPFSPLDSFLGGPSHHHHNHNTQHQHRPSLFMEPLGVGSMFRSPFGPMFMPPPPPSPSLLSMIMRQASSMDLDDDLLPPPPPLPFAHRNPFIPPSQGSLFTTMITNDKDQQQQQQQKNDTRQASQNNSSTELDTMDSLQAQASSRQQPSLNARLFTRPTAARPTTGGGSMVIFSGSGEPTTANNNNNIARASSVDHQTMPFPGFGPFMGMGLPPISPLPPHMVLFGGGSSGSGGDGPSGGPLNPILRSILNNAMSEFSSPLFPQSSTGAEDRHGGNRSSAAKQAAAAAAAARVASGSSMAPSWSMGGAAVGGQTAGPQSSIDPDDEWTGVQHQPAAPGEQGSIDRWDEQMQSKHMRARHRGSADGDSDLESPAGPFDATDFVTGLQLDQQQAGSGGPSMMESIRQTIRGPGLTVERIIEVPSGGRGSGGVGQVGSGAKSQSLSRADYEDYESQPQQQQHHHSRHPGSLMMETGGSTIFGRPMESRSDDGPPIGFIGRLLSDLARGPRNDQHQQARTGRGRAFLDDDLDEGDSSEDSTPMARPPSWPRVHVASARIRMRPVAAAIESRSSEAPATGESSPSQEGAIFMAPAQIGSPSDLESLGSSNEIREQPMKQASRSELPQLQPRGMIPQHLIQHHQQHPGTENPFTSPSSPLFGFPAPLSSSSSSLVGQSSNQEQAKGNQAPTTSTNSNNPKQQGGKQPRSFTYHSNHELATPFASVNINKQQQQVVDSSENNQAVAEQREETMGRARFLGPFAPANIVMGRRLDDQPSEFRSDSAGGIQGNPAQAVGAALPTIMRNQAAFVSGATIADANTNFRTISVA